MRARILLILCALFVACKSDDERSNVELMESFFRSITGEDYNAAYKDLKHLISKDIELPFMLKKEAVTTLSILDDTTALDAYIAKQTKLTKERLCNDESIEKLNLKFCQKFEFVEDVENPEYRRKLVMNYVFDQKVRFNPRIKFVEKYQLSQDTAGYAYTFEETDSIIHISLAEMIEKWGLPTKNTVGKDGMEAFCTFVLHADEWPEWQHDMLLYLKEIRPSHQFINDYYAHIYDRVCVFQNKSKQKYGTQVDSLDTKNKKIFLHEVVNKDSLSIWRKEMDLLPLNLYEILMFEW